MTDAKLTRVLFEFDDGTAKEITGELADEWLKVVESQSIYCGLHRQWFPKRLVEAWEKVGVNR